MNEPKPGYENYINHYRIDAEFGDYFNYPAVDRQALRRRYEELLSKHKIKTTDRVLEIGCGGGQILAFFRRSDFHFIAMDIPVKNLKRIHQQASFPISSVAGDIFYLPFAAKSIDVIILSEVLEHLADPEAALHEIYRVLKNSGVLLLSTPYKEKIQYHLCIHCNKLTPAHAHLHSFDRRKLQVMLEKSGLRARQISLAHNKIAARLYFNVIMQFLPFRIWKLFDRLFNLFIPRATHVLLKAEKS
jgi:ubiquinone/menaquinone biosynthesis C-methylase UbiE